jgi:hypothetical protein
MDSRRRGSAARANHVKITWLLREWHEVSRNLLSYQGLWERMSHASAHGGDRTMLNPTPSYHCVWL